jgi:hypothetical protein
VSAIFVEIFCVCAIAFALNLGEIPVETQYESNIFIIRALSCKIEEKKLEGNLMEKFQKNPESELKTFFALCVNRVEFLVSFGRNEWSRFWRRCDHKSQTFRCTATQLPGV